MQIVYRANDIAEAHLVSGMLGAQGIESFVAGHYLQGAIGEIGVADTALVRVRDEDFEQAKAIVEQYDAELQPGCPRPSKMTTDSNPVGTILKVMLGFILFVLLIISVMA